MSGRTRRAAWSTSALLLLAACGGGPQLTHLRCRDPSCQDVENPLRLLLAVDFSDPTGTLAKGRLDLRVDGQTQQTLQLGALFAAQGLSPDATAGTLQFDQDMVLDRMGQGQKITASLTATNGLGQGSNEPSLSFTLTLGAQ